MSVIVLQAILAAFAVITFAIALRLRSRSRVVTMVFPHEVECRESFGRHREPTLV